MTKDSPAAAAGIQTGDRVTRIDGTEITDFQQLPEIISISGGDTLTIGLNRQSEDLTVYVTPRLMKTDRCAGQFHRSDGDRSAPDPKAPITRGQYSPVGAFMAACSQSWNIVHTTVVGISQMITGKAGVDQLRGPVGIGQMTKQVADFGFLPLLNLVAILSVSIGLANAFSDSSARRGASSVLCMRSCFGRPLGEQAQDVGFRHELALVLGLMLLTTWNDLIRLNLF